eukprot:m.5322 g.5322  ORF g.5322 m.5322 type:complete len:233 (+) comp12887_c0_seq1:27-725(+)
MDAFWAGRWADGSDVWTTPTVHRLLVKYSKKLPASKEGTNRIFVPLCGRTYDMIWLVEQGYRVVGVELIEEAILRFLSEQKLEYSVAEVGNLPGARLYQALDGRLLIYQCDFLSLNQAIIGQFDAIWDRASLLAINPSDNPRYVEVIKDVLKPSGSWLLHSVEIEGEYKGPPFSLPLAKFAELAGSDFTYEELECAEDRKMAKVFKSERGLTHDLVIYSHLLHVVPSKARSQ